MANNSSYYDLSSILAQGQADRDAEQKQYKDSIATMSGLIAQRQADANTRAKMAANNDINDQLTQQEHWGDTASSMAQTGMAVGGPWGALAGGIIGTGVGGYNAMKAHMQQGESFGKALEDTLLDRTPGQGIASSWTHGNMIKNTVPVLGAMAQKQFNIGQGAGATPSDAFNSSLTNDPFKTPSLEGSGMGVTPITSQSGMGFSDMPTLQSGSGLLGTNAAQAGLVNPSTSVLGTSSDLSPGPLQTDSSSNLMPAFNSVADAADDALYQSNNSDPNSAANLSAPNSAQMQNYANIYSNLVRKNTLPKP